MAGISTLERNAVLNALFGAVAYTAPTSYKFALLTANPSDDAGTGAVQATYTGYDVVTLTNNATNFPAAAAGAKSNGVAIEWPEVPSGESETITGIMWTDQSDVYKGFKAVSKSLTEFETPRIPIGDLDLTLTSS